MRHQFFNRVLVSLVASLCLASSGLAASTPEEALAQDVKILLGKSFNSDWEGLEQLPRIKWAPLPPTMLQNCMPDGGCFARQGTMSVAGRNIVVLASGARTIVGHVYFRNSASPIGEDAVLAALKQAGFSAELARCPLPNTMGGTNWYRLTSNATNTGYLSIQTSCGGKACEGLIVTLGDELPPLRPNQLKLYSEQCKAPAAERSQPQKSARDVAAVASPRRESGARHLRVAPRQHSAEAGSPRPRSGSQRMPIAKSSRLWSDSCLSL